MTRLSRRGNAKDDGEGGDDVVVEEDGVSGLSVVLSMCPDSKMLLLLLWLLLAGNGLAR